MQAGAVTEPRVDPRTGVVESPTGLTRESLRQPTYGLLVGEPDRRLLQAAPAIEVDLIRTVDQHVGDTWHRKQAARAGRLPASHDAARRPGRAPSRCPRADARHAAQPRRCARSAPTDRTQAAAVSAPPARVGHDRSSPRRRAGPQRTTGSPRRTGTVTAVNGAADAAVEPVPGVHRAAQRVATAAGPMPPDRLTLTTTIADEHSSIRDKHVACCTDGADLLRDDQHREHRPAEDVDTVRIEVTRHVGDDEVEPAHRCREHRRHGVGQRRIGRAIPRQAWRCPNAPAARRPAIRRSAGLGLRRGRATAGRRRAPSRGRDRGRRRADRRRTAGPQSTSTRAERQGCRQRRRTDTAGPADHADEARLAPTVERRCQRLEDALLVDGVEHVLRTQLAPQSTTSRRIADTSST